MCGSTRNLCDRTNIPKQHILLMCYSLVYKKQKLDIKKVNHKLKIKKQFKIGENSKTKN